MMARAVAVGRQTIPIGKLARALGSHDREHAERYGHVAMNAVEVVLRAEAPPLFMNLLVAGADVANRELRPRGRALRAAAHGDAFAFDQTNPQAVQWATDNAAVLVKDVTDETRAAIREIITLAFNEGIPPDRAARMIRGVIGLTERGATAVDNLRLRIEENAGGLIRAGNVPIRVPEDGMTAARLERTLQAYADRLTRQRALVIARTETLRASNEGQRQLWQQAVQVGLLSGHERREWISTPDERECLICEDLDGKTAGLHDNFESATEGGILGPPAHPNCRCTTGIVADAHAEAQRPDDDAESVVEAARLALEPA